MSSSYRAVINDFGSARDRRSLAPEKKGTESAGAQAREDAAAGSISPKVQFNDLTMELTLTAPKSSLRWTAPEVLNHGILDLPSDIWALGWVSWEVSLARFGFGPSSNNLQLLLHVRL